MRGLFIAAAALAGTTLAAPAGNVEERNVVGASGWYQTKVNGKMETVHWTTQYNQGAGAAPTPVAQPKGQQAPPPQQPQPQQQPKGQNSPAPAPAPGAAPNAPSSSGSGAGNDYQKNVLDSHNSWRAKHGAAPLKWDASLANVASQIGNTCKYEHSKAFGDGNYGQNIAAGTKPADVAKVIDGMYTNEEPKFRPYYGQANPQNFMEWGHFTQIVWKATDRVGCATVDCSSRGLANAGGNIPPFFTVCNYASPGNFAGKYAENVARPK